jgi:hypothetical protein
MFTIVSVKGKVVCHEDIWGSGGIAPSFLSSTLDGGEWSASCPVCFTARERALGTHWIGGLGGPQSRSGDCGEEKIYTVPGIEPRQSSL